MPRCVRPKIYKIYFSPDDPWGKDPQWFRLPYKRFLDHKAVKIKLFGIFTIYDVTKKEKVDD